MPPASAQTETMKALVKSRACKGLWLETAPIPAIGPKDVLIKVHKTGICGTDLHIYNWDAWARQNVPVPLITGHEFGGEIVAIGNEVDGFATGQRVSGEGHIVGTESRNARAGRLHLAPDTKGLGVHRSGAFAEFLSLPASNVIALPDDLPMEIAAILDPLGNAVHAVLKFDVVAEDVLITGAGPVGILSAAVARHVGARHVVVTDVNSYRLALAAQVADIRPVNVAEEDLHDVMHELDMREGFDIGIEASGAAPVLNQMIDVLTMGGRMASVGIPGEALTIDWGKLVLKGIIINAIYGREMFETWYKMLAMLRSGLDVSRLITHRLPAEEYEAGFNAMASGETGKIVLDWTGIAA